MSLHRCDYNMIGDRDVQEATISDHLLRNKIDSVGKKITTVSRRKEILVEFIPERKCYSRIVKD